MLSPIDAIVLRWQTSIADEVLNISHAECTAIVVSLRCKSATGRSWQQLLLHFGVHE